MKPSVPTLAKQCLDRIKTVIDSNQAGWVHSTEIKPVATVDVSIHLDETCKIPCTVRWNYDFKEYVCKFEMGGKKYRVVYEGTGPNTVQTDDKVHWSIYDQSLHTLRVGEGIENLLTTIMKLDDLGKIAKP